MLQKKMEITSRISKTLLLFSLSAFVAPAAYSHEFYSRDPKCDDGHSIFDKNFRTGAIKGPNRKCFDIPKGTYREVNEGFSEWDECPKGSYCPGGSAGRLEPDEYSIAPDEEMSEPIACPKNKISDKRRRACSYPAKLSEWDRLLDTKPKGSKYKDGKLVCKKGKNYSKQKGICR